jgi:uncharacterized protein (UPF0261 family)
MNWRWMMAAIRSSIRDRFDGMMPLLWRSVAILAGAAVVAEVMFALLGQPTPARLYAQDEIARFHPTLVHAVVQFGGKGALLALMIYAGRRWLRMRL